MTRRGASNAKGNSSSGTETDKQALVGGSDVSGSDYAKRSKVLMQLYQELCALGADMFFDLPKIAVVGAQSAGKSSLIEAVSGISVPRDSGICTRCPVEISMSSLADEWKCTISLRFEYDPSGNQQQVSALKLFCTLSSSEKPSVDLWLRRAQASILHPERPISDFQTMTLGELKRLRPGEGSMLSFSRNVIQVRLEDPEATDLTFVDLPGLSILPCLIQNASDEEILLAQDLVNTNIQGSNTLILVTIPMSGSYILSKIDGTTILKNTIDEMENQEAAKLAKKMDSSGNRTIGVLTKPDSMSSGAIGSRQRWQDVLQGRIYPLHHGYYCVRLADDAERALRLTRIESERLSADFFAKTEPWGTLDQSRFGVPNFVRDISQLLLMMIETNLPQLKLIVEQLISDFSEKLGNMPKALTTEPTTEIILGISKFCRDLRDAVMGEDHKRLVQQNKAHYEELKTAIEQTNPEFWPFYSKSDYRNPGLHVGVRSMGPLDLQDVQNEIADATGWELLGIIPFDAVKNIFLKSTSTWRPSTIKCFNSVFKTTRDTAEELVRCHFKQFKKLEFLINTLCSERLDECKNEVMAHLEKLLKHESEPLFTLNPLFEKEQTTWYQKYSDSYQNSWQFHRLYPNKAASLMASESMTDRNALRVMAIVSAYFPVASKRLIDAIPLGIEHQLNQLFAKTIEQTFIERIMLGPQADVAGRLKDLLSEDKEVADRRQSLEERLARV
ncbi:hypothetical protein D9757_012099 [Collybiopsis confluens]|uniref:Uncharacterized protein n=1 Tax=Collybiopsis confluens TaxID=2823264 RepID=A0A8H5D542_9AGAR|nr:hypothetical protein D9757_012099 [Collybiopsis confluens]